MSTATAVVENGQVGGITKEQAFERWGAPPEGKRYRLVGGFVLLGNDLRPVIVDAKKKGARKGSGKGKKAGLKYAVPSGGLQSADAPGFETGKHNKLTAADFGDKGHYLEWCVWYEKQRVSLAEKALEEHRQASTPEGKAKLEENKIQAAFLKALEQNPALAQKLLEIAAAKQIG